MTHPDNKPLSEQEQAHIRLAMTVVNVKQNVPAMQELSTLVARERFHQYTEYMTAGFTEEQSMTLVLRAIAAS